MSLPAPAMIRYVRNPKELAKHFIDGDFVAKVLSSLGTKVLLFLFSIATSVLVSRALGPNGRGIYALAITLSALGVQFGNLGLHSSNTFYSAKNPELLPTLISNTLVVSLLGGGVVAGIFWAVFISWPHLAPVQGLSLILGLIGIPVGLAYLLLQNLLLGCYRVKAYNYIEIVNRLVNISVLATLLLLTYMSPSTAIGTSLFAAFVGAALCLVQLVKESDLAKPSWQLLRGTFGYAFKAYLLAFLSFTVLKADIIITKFLLGTDQTGQYSVAVSLADILCVAPITVGSILFPKLTAMSDPGRKWRMARNISYLVGAAMAAIALAVYASAPLLVRTLFGQEFISAAPALAWLMPGVVFISMTGVWSMYVGSINIPLASIGVFFAMSALNIWLNFILLPVLGIVGASIASSTCYLGCLIGILLIAQRCKKQEVAHRSSISAPQPVTVGTRA